MKCTSLVDRTFFYKLKTEIISETIEFGEFIHGIRFVALFQKSTAVSSKKKKERKNNAC